MEEDRELIKKIKGGDREAFETLVLKYRKQAIAFVTSLTKRPSEAEDITQEVFAKIYIHNDQFDLNKSFRPYLFTMLRNQSFDFLKSHQSDDFIDYTEIDYLLSKNNSLNDYINSFEQQEVFKELLKLPLKYRTTLYLFAIENLSYKEVGEATQQSIPQVKIRIHRARKLLKERWKGDIEK